MSKEEDKKKKKKKQQSILEKEIFAIMQKSIKAATQAALDDLLKDFKYPSGCRSLREARGGPYFPKDPQDEKFQKNDPAAILDVNIPKEKIKYISLSSGIYIFIIIYIIYIICITQSGDIKT